MFCLLLGLNGWTHCHLSNTSTHCYSETTPTSLNTYVIEHLRYWRPTSLNTYVIEHLRHWTPTSLNTYVIVLVLSLETTYVHMHVRDTCVHNNVNHCCRIPSVVHTHPIRPCRYTTQQRWNSSTTRPLLVSTVRPLHPCPPSQPAPPVECP